MFVSQVVWDVCFCLSLSKVPRWSFGAKCSLKLCTRKRWSARSPFICGFRAFQGALFSPLCSHMMLQNGGGDISMLQKKPKFASSPHPEELSLPLAGYPQNTRMNSASHRRRRALSRLTCQIQDMMSELCSSKIGIWRFSLHCTGCSGCSQEFEILRKVLNADKTYVL